MAQREVLALIFFLGSAIALAISLVYLVAARQPRYTVTEILLAGPFLFLSPEEYFRAGQNSRPWRALLIWLVPSITLFAVWVKR